MSEPTAGGLLRAAREKQGLHIAALAAAIKVAPRKLDALENDRWAELPDATFIRALAQTVCRTLKIESRPVLDLLPPAPAVALDPKQGGLNEPFRERPGREDPGLAGAAIRPMVWAALLLMVAAVAVYFVPEGWFAGQLRRAPAPPVEVAVQTPALPAPAAAAAAAPSVAVVLEPGALAASAPLPALAAAEPASAPAPTAGETVFSAPATAVAGSGEMAAPAGPVQLRTSEASWIEVRDGRGQLLLSRTVLPGESVGLDGRLPIRLTIGNAAATQLGFRGQPVDLATRTRDNIARVELQ
jgi:cytoskeleton protein RodZ